MSMILSIYRHRIRALEEMVEDWKAGRAESADTAEFVPLLPECIALAVVLSEQLEHSLRAFLDNTAPNWDYNKRELLLGQMNKAAALLDGVVLEADQLARSGRVIPHRDELAAAMTRLKAAITILAKTCPAFDPDMFEKTGDDIRNGRVHSAEELLRDAQSHCA